MTPEEQVKELKAKITKLENQVQILRDAVEFASDAASGIMLSLDANEKIEAFKKAELLQKNSLNAMSTSLGGPDIYT